MKRGWFLISPWKFPGAMFTALIALFLVGCAGGSAKPTRALSADVPPVRPSVFLIYDFAVNPDDVIVDLPGLTSGKESVNHERLTQGKAWANALSESLVMQLVKEGITSRRATGSTQIPLNAIVVKGQFISIDEGDQVKRTTIGFGMGAEEVRTMVQVYQMRKAGLLRISEIEAEAHGRKTPGVAGPGVVAAAGGMAAGLVISSAMNVKSDVIDSSMQTTVDNLAEKLVERAVSYYKKRGWL